VQALGLAIHPSSRALSLAALYTWDIRSLSSVFVRSRKIRSGRPGRLIVDNSEPGTRTVTIIAHTMTSKVAQ